MPISPSAHSLRNSLRNVKLYDVPMPDARSSAVNVDSPAVTFEFAGNWYITGQENGKFSKNPEDWSLIHNGQRDPTFLSTQHYHAPEEPYNISVKLVDLVCDIGYGLTAKKNAGTLIPSKSILNSEEMEKIILSKEHAGAGLQLADGSHVHDIIQNYGNIFATTPEEQSRISALVRSGFNFNFPETPYLEERLALFRASGEPFMPMASTAARERSFYKFDTHDPEIVHRLSVGFDELLQPDGSRAHRPSVKVTMVPFSQTLTVIDNDHLFYAPEGIAAFFKGDKGGIAHYTKTHMAPELEARRRHKESGEIDYWGQTTTDPLFGENIKANKLETHTWYRPLRPQDYVPETVISNMPRSSGSTALAEKVLNPDRADYFIVRYHPDYAEAVKNEDKKKFPALYSGPKQQLLFLKGNTTLGNPFSVEAIDIRSDRDLIRELANRGIQKDTILVKIGHDEYAALWNQRQLKDHINYFQLEHEKWGNKVLTRL